MNTSIQNMPIAFAPETQNGDLPEKGAQKTTHRKYSKRLSDVAIATGVGQQCDANMRQNNLVTPKKMTMVGKGICKIHVIIAQK